MIFALLDSFMSSLNVSDLLLLDFQVRSILISEIKSRAAKRVEKKNKVTGVSTPDVTFNYVLPTETRDGRVVAMPVCRNAFALAYHIGKNTRTAYEQSAREEILQLVPTVGARALK